MRSLVTLAAAAVLTEGLAQPLHVTPGSAFVYGAASDPTLVQLGIIVWNDTNVSLDVWCTRVELSIVPGSDNAFAWSTSLPPGVATDPVPMSVAPLGYSASHQGIYFPNGTTGSSVIQYCFYSQPSMADSVCAVVTYTTGTTGTVDPADARPLFGYDGLADMLFASDRLSSGLAITVTDASGREMLRAELRPGGRVSCAQLPPGTYLATAGGTVVRFARY